MAGAKRITYDLQAWPLPRYVEELLGMGPLHRLHEIQDYPLVDREHDQSTVFHEVFYSSFKGSWFSQLYLRWLKAVIEPLFGERLIVQAVPSFRVHLPGNLAVGELHRDRDYGHGDGEVNIWVPLTETEVTSTVIVEDDDGHLVAYLTQTGEALIFDGVNRRHGNRQNLSERTRVSFDARVIPVSRYKPRAEASINTGLKFEVGGYFREL